MLRKIVSALGASLLMMSANSQDTTAVEQKSDALKISGSVDVYYRYNFSKDFANNYTSFTNSQNSFELGMASVKLEKGFGKVGFVADLGFGKRAKEFAYNDEGITQAIKQLFVTYAPTDKLTFTAGSWATHVGYELVDPQLNRNYSMSYMFSYGPFTHTGVKADYKFGNSGVMLGISNPTDQRTTGLAPKYIIGQFSTGTKNEKLKLYLNYVGGKSSDSSKMNQLDAVITYGATDKLSFGVNGTAANYKDKIDGKFGSTYSWWGSALYVNYDPAEKLGLTLRSEYFSDNKKINVFRGVPGNIGGNIIANTLSANIHLGVLTIIPEFRYEAANKAIFVDSKGNGSKTSATALVAAVLAF